MRHFALFAALAFALGCSDPDSPRPYRPPSEVKPTSSTPMLAAAVPTPAIYPHGPAGTITGSVKLWGPRPDLPRLSITGSGYCLEQWQREGGPPDPTVVLGPGHELANVLVHIRQGVPRGAAPPAAGAVLAQRRCQYSPHVVAMQAGQTLEILNLDPEAHHPQIYSEVNPAISELQPADAPSILVERTQPELSVPIRCELHPWMTAVLHVLDHPYFALTGPDGGFTIAGLPPGDYEIEALHERYGSKTARVTLREDAGQRVHFQFP